MRVLVLGATGMAGHVIFQYLKETGHEVLGTKFRNRKFKTLFSLDATNFTSVKELVNNVKPDAVVNAIGVLVSESKENPVRSITLNGVLPHFLSELAQKKRIKFVHISTDCVFSGRNGNYKESSFRDADDLYGRSKAIGELNNSRDLTIRTSIIGPEVSCNGSGLFDWFMGQTTVISGFSNVMWSGVTTIALARGISSAISQDLSGLYHLTNGIKISKYELLGLMKNIFKRDILIEENGEYFSDKSFTDSRQELKYQVPGYEELVLEMYNYIRKNKSSYPHY